MTLTRPWVMALILFSLLWIPLDAGGKDLKELEKEFKQLADKNLAADVGQAIDRGVAWLVKTQQADGSWDMAGLDLKHPGGPTSLALYALVNSKIHPDRKELQDKAAIAIEKGFAYMKDKCYLPGSTYGDSTLIMALESRLKRAKVDPLKRYGHMNKGAGVNPKADLEWMTKLTEELISFKNKHTFGKIRAHPMLKYTKMVFYGWGYPVMHDKPGAMQARTDLSNTQYAALGLAAAHRAGVEIDKEVFRGLVGMALATQEMRGKQQQRLEIIRSKIEDKREGSESEIEIETIYGYGITKSEGIEYKKTKKKDEARGWGYCKSGGETAQRSAYGSMTTAGLTMLLAGQIALQEDEAYKKNLEPYVRESIYDGLAWLGMTFDPTLNPNKSAKYDNWTLYYLYGMERVGMMAGVENFGKHLWYRKGALRLVRTQNDDGSWGPSSLNFGVDTCFALLFLSRSTQAVGFTPDDPPPELKTKYEISEGAE